MAAISLRRPHLESTAGSRIDEQSHYRGIALRSSFQPIIAVAQTRAAGVEALLRASDAQGANVAPMDLFGQAARRNEGLALDQLACHTHLRSYANWASDERWLFLNCRPESLVAGPDGRSALENIAYAHGYNPTQIVIELLEHASMGHDDITHAIKAHQAKGFQVAIDDFGIGSSNFDRVWGVRPDFVKLDRSLVQRASLTRNDRRVAKMLVSMLHRMGVMVVAEGVETSEEALAVMDADVDFVQGFFFSWPTAAVTPSIQLAEDSLRALWPQLSELVTRVGTQEQAQISAVRTMLIAAARELQTHGSLEDAGQRFFCAPSTLSCFLLNQEGFQVGSSVHASALDLELLRRAGPIFYDGGTNWSRRPYFKDAIRNPGKAYIHGPHRSMVEGAFIYTAAITVDINHELHVLCGNFRMDAEELSVGEDL